MTKLGSYLTAGGATVDITITTPAEERHQTAEATCSGALCGATKAAHSDISWTTDDRNLPADKSRQIRGHRAAQHSAQQLAPWAQQHADTCRATPAGTGHAIDR
ncbi:hypothetical protein ACPC54_23595 [Kitasatospora sp. NPDC094028]